jgi:hypothetical protein
MVGLDPSPLESSVRIPVFFDRIPYQGTWGKLSGIIDLSDDELD